MSFKIKEKSVATKKELRCEFDLNCQITSDYRERVHDIKNMMNAVTGMAEMLLETELKDNQLKYCRLIEDSANRILDLLDQPLLSAD